MKKVTPIGDIEDLRKLSRAQFHKIWFIESKTERKIAKLYGTTRKEVRKRRKELKLNLFNSAILYVAGGNQYHEKNLWKN